MSQERYRNESDLQAVVVVIRNERDKILQSMVHALHLFRSFLIHLSYWATLQGRCILHSIGASLFSLVKSPSVLSDFDLNQHLRT